MYLIYTWEPYEADIVLGYTETVEDAKAVVKRLREENKPPGDWDRREYDYELLEKLNP